MKIKLDGLTKTCLIQTPTRTTNRVRHAHTFFLLLLLCIYKALPNLPCYLHIETKQNLSQFTEKKYSFKGVFSLIVSLKESENPGRRNLFSLLIAYKSPLSL